MTQKFRYFMLLCFAIISLIMVSQPVQERNSFWLNHLSTQDGLDNMRVFSILQGSKGELWISTRNGINRYNGSNIFNYHLDSDGILSNAAGRIIQLAKNRQGRVMAYDNKGNIYSYDESVDKFTPVALLKNHLSGAIKLNRIYCSDALWLAMQRGVYVLKGVRAVKVYGRDEANDFAAMDGRMAVGLSHGVVLIDMKSHKANVLKGSETLNVQSLYYDNETGFLWVGTLFNGVRIYDAKRREWVVSPELSRIPSNPVRAFAVYDSQTMMIGVDGGGIYKADRRRLTSSLFLNAGNETGNAISGNGIYALCVDKDQNLWCGSYTGGVDVAFHRPTNISFFRHEYKDAQSLLANNVNDVCETADGTLWFATDIGLSIYHPHTGHWQHTMQGQVVVTLCGASSSSVWAGTYGHGVSEVTGNGNAQERFSMDKGNLKASYITSLFQDGDGDLWIGSIEGALACVSNGVVRDLPVNEVQCLAMSPDGRVAAGTPRGFRLINKRTGKIDVFYTDTEFADRDVNLFIEAMVFNRDNTVWLATDGGGVSLYNYRTRKIVKMLGKKDRLPSDIVSALLRDNSGNLYISTDKGLSMLAANKAEVKNLSLVKGVDQEYNRMSCALLRDGRIAFGGNSGAVLIDPLLIGSLHYHAKLNFLHMTPVLSGNQLDDEELQHLYKMLLDGDVALSYDQNTFEVSVECINYRFQYDISYEYQLEGFDEEWIAMPYPHALRYTNLPPGDYVLHVRALSKSDGRVLDSKDLKISVAHPWYNAPLTRLLYVLIFAGIVWLLWRNYRNRLERRYYDEKMSFFVNTAHDIRTPLSLVLAPLNNLVKDQSLSERSKGFLQMAQRNGDKLMKMVTQLLDFQKVETNHAKLNVQQIALSKLLSGAVDRFRALAVQKGLSLTLGEYPEKDVWIDVSITEIILDNLLSNAIKYTDKGGCVSLYAVENEEGLSISVKDTGIGIPKKDQEGIFGLFYRAANAVSGKEMGSGLGLMISRQMAAKMHTQLTFKSEEGLGTTFTLGPIPTRATQPAAEQPHASLPVAPLADEAAAEKTGERLIFVDDNEELRSYVNMAYGNIYQIKTYSNAEEALEYLDKGGLADIIVSDVMMPGMKGDELCQRIKENAETSWLPVILLTAKAGKTFMIDGLNVGADDYVTKPFDPEILRSKIDSMLKNRRRMSKYYLEKALQMVRKEDTPAEADTETVSKEGVQLNEADKDFVDKATKLVLEHLAEEDFDINSLCREMAMSRTLFYGRLKTLTGKTPQEFLRLIRLEQALIYLKQGESVADAAFKTGFANTKYFSTVFKKQFGESPSRIAKK